MATSLAMPIAVAAQSPSRLADAKAVEAVLFEYNAAMRSSMRRGQSVFSRPTPRSSRRAAPRGSVRKSVQAPLWVIDRRTDGKLAHGGGPLNGPSPMDAGVLNG